MYCLASCKDWQKSSLVVLSKARWTNPNTEGCWRCQSDGFVGGYNKGKRRPVELTLVHWPTSWSESWISNQILSSALANCWTYCASAFCWVASAWPCSSLSDTWRDLVTIQTIHFVVLMSCFPSAVIIFNYSISPPLPLCLLCRVPQEAGSYRKRAQRAEPVKLQKKKKKN